MSLHTTVVALVVASALSPALLFADGPLTLHGENPRYFEWRGQPTVLITSGEHYGALLNLDFDYNTYFKTLQADGLNHTRTFSGTYREVASSFGITDNPLAPKPLRFACPWARSGTPGYSEGGNKFDLTKFDPAYFERLHDFMQKADAAGVVIEYTLFCPLYRDELWDASPMNAKNNINGVGDCDRTDCLTLKHKDLLDVQLAFTRRAVTELNHYDNLYIEVCNEPYFGGVTDEWQRRIIREIVATEENLPKKHLISMNIANGRKKVENPDPNVSIFNFHYCTPPDAVALNWGLNRVIGENETGFRGSHDLLYRTEAWDFLLAGGALYNNLDYSFTPDHPDGTLSDYKSPGGGSPALRKQLGILKRFLEDFDFLKMRPDADVVKSVAPELAVQALVEPGKQYGVYLHVPLPKKPKAMSDHIRDGIEAELTVALPKGRYRAEWLDTKTGEITAEQTFGHPGGDRQLSSPAFDNDLALRIITAK